MYNLTAKQINGDLVIQYYDSPEPTKVEKYERFGEHTLVSRKRFQDAKEEWKSSLKTVKVKEECKQEFIDLIFNHWNLKLLDSVKNPYSFEKMLSKGIDISSIAERIEIKEESCCKNSCDWPKCTFSDCKEKHPEKWCNPYEKFAILKPINKTVEAVEFLLFFINNKEWGWLSQDESKEVTKNTILFEHVETGKKINMNDYYQIFKDKK